MAAAVRPLIPSPSPHPRKASTTRLPATGRREPASSRLGSARRSQFKNASNTERNSRFSFVSEVGPISRKRSRSGASVPAPLSVNCLGAVSSQSGPRCQEVCAEAIPLRRAGRCNRHHQRQRSATFIRRGFTPLTERLPEQTGSSRYPSVRPQDKSSNRRLHTHRFRRNDSSRLIKGPTSQSRLRVMTLLQ